jgi:hypothetical protein
MAWHTRTFGLLGFESQASAAAEVAVHQAERRLGMSLPPSVRDWYVREDALRILAEHSNGDPPVPLTEFAVLNWQSRRLLPFRHENQGVCTWAIDVNGSDDPPVYVDVDTDGREWQLLAPGFSQYVYSCVWDYRLVFGQPGLVEAQNRALSPSALGILGSGFRQEVQTHGWPGSTQYRFHRDRQAILIWDGPGQADWFVAAPTAETLESALIAVWQLDDVGKSLYDCSQLGRETLERVRTRA